MPNLDTGDVFSCVFSSESVDRDGEVLIPDGCDTSNYRNGPVFFDHDTTKLIGVCQHISTSKAFPKRLQATVNLLPEAVCSEQVDTARNILRHAIPLGLKPGISIGFLRHETRKATRQDRERYGTSCRRVTSKWELLEISLSLVQSNRDAFIVGVSKGYFTEAGLRSLGYTGDGRRKVVVSAYVPKKTLSPGEYVARIRSAYSWGNVLKHNPTVPKSAVPEARPMKRIGKHKSNVSHFTKLQKRFPQVKHWVSDVFGFRPATADERLEAIVNREMDRLMNQ